MIGRERLARPVIGQIRMLIENGGTNDANLHRMSQLTLPMGLSCAESMTVPLENDGFSEFRWYCLYKYETI